MLLIWWAIPRCQTIISTTSTLQPVIPRKISGSDPPPKNSMDFRHVSIIRWETTTPHSQTVRKIGEIFKDFTCITQLQDHCIQMMALSISADAWQIPQSSTAESVTRIQAAACSGTTYPQPPDWWHWNIWNPTPKGKSTILIRPIQMISFTKWPTNMT